MATRKRYFPRDNITTECEIFNEENSDSEVKYNKCSKKEGHKNYIPVNDLKMEDLPDECQTKEFMDGLKLRCDLTVKVIVRYISMNRPLKYIDSDKDYPSSGYRGSDRWTRTGTGYIRPDSIQFPIKGKPCPCSLCIESGEPKNEYLDLSIFTATHLVFDNEEARQTVFECFYDSADRIGVKIICGQGVTDPDELKRCVNDCCVVNCVTHDSELIKRLLKVAEKRGVISISNPSASRGVIISHPHGLSKQVSIGKILYCGVHKDPRLPQGVPYEFGKDAKCRMPSSDQQCLSLSSTHNTPLLHHAESAKSQVKGSGEEPCEKHNNNILTFDTVISPGNEYSLPPEMTFKLPIDSASFCTFQLPISYSTQLWVKFPEGTQFFLPDGKVLPLPQEIEFCWKKGKATANNKTCVYVAYDMATCTGSSGAMVFRCDSCWGIFPNFPHCGHEEGGGINRSSNIMLFCYYETWMAFPSICK